MENVLTFLNKYAMLNEKLLEMLYMNSGLLPTHPKVMKIATF